MTLRGRFVEYQGHALAYFNHFTQAKNMTFDEAKDNLKDLRKRWYAGEPCGDQMRDAAKVAADIYNQKAKTVAAKFKMRPRLISADKIMRSIDRAVDLRP